jgi:hypothetical protein
MRYRAARMVRDHPTMTWSTLASIAAVIATVSGGGAWIIAHLALKSELIAHERHDATVESYNAVKIDNLRVERLGDEVDQLNQKSQFEKLKPFELAQLGLWQRKLNKAATELVADQATAKASTKEGD